MSDEDRLLENSWNGEGLRTVHVARMGAAVRREGWLERLPAGAWDTLEMRGYEERPMRVWHFWMWWLGREVVEIGGNLSAAPLRVSEAEPRGSGVLGVIWGMLKGQRMSEAIREGAERYFLDMGREAGVCVVRALPAGAPTDGRVRVEVLGRRVEVGLVVAGWAPRGSVVVLGGREEAEWLSRGR